MPFEPVLYYPGQHGGKLLNHQSWIGPCAIMGCPVYVTAILLLGRVVIASKLYDTEIMTEQMSIADS